MVASHVPMSGDIAVARTEHARRSQVPMIAERLDQPTRQRHATRPPLGAVTSSP
jgi:hypothetical protein